ncbi:subtilisin-like protease SBT1.1 isoform X1 [Solanum dulcamara]|uniref:subtilisin-like protease SBT1.1 isoform X1 n=2 Tax=Solanum dulcamara TaxID=45834 RepID=UPI0024852EAF|nr:subtilisin-like protease SBT1.1 isoform X1 [Solanum dulcamara]
MKMNFRNCVFLLAYTVSVISFTLAEQDIYVVHMDKTKVRSLDSYLGISKRWYEDVISSISADSEEEQEEKPPQLLYVYEKSVSGFSAKLSKKQLESLKQVDGFLTAVLDEMLSLHTTHSPQFLGLKSGRGLWGAPNLTSDVIVGMIDTGIWPEHVSFHDSGMPPVPSHWKGKCEAGTKFMRSNCNRKIIGARIFSKGYEAAAGKINEKKDYRSPRDSQGHGTHTASTAAGNLVNGANLFGLAKGLAGGMSYGSRIAVYKACFMLGCSSSDVLAAIDQAVIDGVDVLSLSLGGLPKPFYVDNIAIAAFGAVQHGVFVSCSAGNSGPLNSSVGNAAPWIMTVAASSLDRSFPTTVKLGDGHVFKGASLYTGKPTMQLPLVYGRTAGGEEARFCTNGTLSSRLVKGKIVVCDKGINARAEKGEQVKIAGGAGMIMVNRVEEGDELYADAHVLPATSLGASAGIAIKNYINLTKTATASIKFEGTVYGNRAPIVAAFSSRGPSAAGPDIIKPDVTAPGVDILAAWPPNISPSMLKSDKRSMQFNILSGTSMSCPHVSGLAALLKSVHRDWSPAAIKSALLTTAYTLDKERTPIADAVSETSISATPFTFGSGHVDPERASDPGLIYDISTEDYLHYICSLNYNSSQIALLLRENYTCPTSHSFQSPGDLNYPSFAVLFDSKNQHVIQTFKRTVTNVGTPRSTYSVQVEAPYGVSVTVKPKILKFQKKGQKMRYKVRFVVAKGKRSPGDSTFGSLTWISRTHIVRSPIATTWH